MMKLLLFPALLIAAGLVGQTDVAPPRLSAGQLAELRALIQETERRDIELQAQLRDLQALLTDAYATFDIDEEHVRRLRRRIAATQDELLQNYHRLQVGFRRIVGPEHFPRIKARLDHYLETTEQRRSKEADRADDSTRPPATAPAAAN